jgi:hypothetical protein
MRIRLLLLAAALTLAGAMPAAEGANLFDAPAKVIHLPLSADPANPQAKAQLSCFYYPHFMVKEVDLGELGAEQLSLIPVAPGAKPPVCQKENLNNEIVISGDDWSGYFWGVKGNYVLFTAEDGWNDGMGFAVFNTDAKKIFEDVAKTWHSLQAANSGLSMRYERVYEAPCSIKGEDGQGCWAQIQKDTGLTNTAVPDCTATYQAEQQRTPNLAQQVLNDPTVFDYNVSAVVSSTMHMTKPVSGKVLNCRPAE